MIEKNKNSIRSLKYKAEEIFQNVEQETEINIQRESI